MKRIKLFEKFEETDMNQSIIDLILKSPFDLTKEERSKLVEIPTDVQNKIKLDNGFISFKAVENGQQFIIIAKDLKDAQSQAELWNAEITGESK